MKKIKEFFGILKLVFPIFYFSEKKLTLAMVISSVIHGAMWGLSIFALRYFYDSVADMAAGAAIKVGLTGLAVYSGAKLFQQFMNGLDNMLSNTVFERIEPYFHKKLAEKLAKIEPARFEDPEMLDSINKAQSGASAALSLAFVLSFMITFYLTVFAVAGVTLYKFKPELVLIIFLIFLPLAISQILRTTVFNKLSDELAAPRRKYEYFESSITSREYFKETRLFGAFNMLKIMFIDAISIFSKKTWQAEKKTAINDIFLKCLSMTGYIFILFMLFKYLLSGEISVGVFASVFSSIGMLFSIMTEIISRHIGNVAKQIGDTRNFVKLMNAPERGGSDITPEDYSVRLENVTYRYPGAETDSVKGVSLNIAQNETIAIVGENGAGKTTLSRLITGIYLPKDGEAYIGGIRTRDMSLKSLLENTSAVFQKFMKYKLTLKDNVILGRSDSGEEPSAYINKSGLDMSSESFPSGEETMLSREFDGTDISGGQWQRVAIARGLYRNHNLIVLDEPTSAIDPLEETRLYHEFADISKDKTAVIITHRVGSARIADRIVVMDDGKISEIGSHDELIAKNGKYSALVAAQAEWYK